MTDYPLVSCLMPTKNRRAFISRALAMFAAQDYPNTELVIVADGDDITDLLPSDHGWKKVKYGPRDRWGDPIIVNDGSILHVRFEGTLGAKLNHAAQLASGAICINWDDDDWNAPDRISTQVAHMQLTGKPVVGFSSLIYYAEGADYGWEYTGDAWYASGSSHCYTRDYVLAHPRPDMTVGEDNVWGAEAKKLNAISNISGLTCLVACDHANNCSARMFGTELYDLMRQTSDNFRRVPLSEFSSTIGPSSYGSHS
jgi:glycosyltransferase involved in cell wall biosynthesis